MRRLIAATATVAVAGAIWVWADQGDSRPLPQLIPAGAVLYLEAKDFHHTITEWDNSRQKAAWVASKNFEILSQSRLIGRLAQAQTEFEAVANPAIDMKMVGQISGGRSALAMYDVSFNFSFVYVTAMDEKAAQTAELVKNRTGFSGREIAGIPFYIRTANTENSQRTVAFAAYKGWLVVSDNEELMTKELMLLAGKPSPALETEPWFHRVATQQPDTGDLRLIYDFNRLEKTPQFRTYWVQQNQTYLKKFAAGVSDVFEGRTKFEERRTILRVEAPETKPDSNGLADVLAYVPENASFYEASAQPDQGQVGQALRQVLTGERVTSETWNAPAPEVTADAGQIGSESDLEVRIDEKPFEPNADPVKAFIGAVAAMQPTAIMQAKMTRMYGAGDTFVVPSGGVAIAVKQVNQAAIDKERGELDELDPVTIKVEGNVLIMSRTPLSRKPVSEADFTGIAVYDHRAEYPKYRKLFALVGASMATNPNELGAAAGPAFFSSNLESLADSWGPLKRVVRTTRDRGDSVAETVTYELQ